MLPFKNAPYTGGTQFIFALLLMPGKLDIRSIDAALEKGATPWGVNSEQTTEEYRHWPWNDTQAAICYTHERHSSLAMNWLMKQKNWCSSLGAIPEKIRLDGFAIGYWYTTTHAILQFAICEALAFADGEEIFLAYGFDDRWLDFAVDGMALPGSLILSYRIEKGKLISLCLENATTLERKMKVSLNPVFDGGILTETLIIPACGSIAVL